MLQAATSQIAAHLPYHLPLLNSGLAYTIKESGSYSEANQGLCAAKGSLALHWERIGVVQQQANCSIAQGQQSNQAPEHRRLTAQAGQRQDQHCTKRCHHHDLHIIWHTPRSVCNTECFTEEIFAKIWRKFEEDLEEENLEDLEIGHVQDRPRRNMLGL